MAFATDNPSTDHSMAGSGSNVQEGYVWVMSHSDQPKLIRLGSSLEQPDTLNNAATDIGWRLDYYALVDDRQQAHAAASNFLAPFRRDRHLYETDAVVAATAIENSSVPIQFRKTSFSDSIEADVDNVRAQPQSVIAAEESAETRSVRQRAMAKLLFDAEQLLEDSELVTGPISYERAFPSPKLDSAPDTATPGAALAKQATAIPEKAPVALESEESASDALTHRSPMNELLTTETTGRARRKSIGKPLGSTPPTRTPPPAPPMPPRERPQPDREEFAIPFASTDDDVQSLDENTAAHFEDQNFTDDNYADADIDAYYEDQLQADLQDSAFDPEEVVTPGTTKNTKTESPRDREILMQMERLIVQREARQNLRAIRSRIGWATIKGVAFGALLGLILMLALNVPDEIALLIGFIAVGAILGAGLMGIYQSSRLWSAAAHWRRIATHG